MMSTTTIFTTDPFVMKVHVVLKAHNEANPSTPWGDREVNGYRYYISRKQDLTNQYNMTRVERMQYATDQTSPSFRALTTVMKNLNCQLTALETLDYYFPSITNPAITVQFDRGFISAMNNAYVIPAYTPIEEEGCN